MSQSSLKNFIDSREPKMPAAQKQENLTTGRTSYPQLDLPIERLKQYTVKEVSMSTQRSINIETEASRKMLFPLPVMLPPTNLSNLSIDDAVDQPQADLSRKHTESQRSNMSPGEEYEQGYQASQFVSEEEGPVRPRFKKYQSQSHLRNQQISNHYVPQTEAQLRMEQRYLNGINREIRLKHEEEELLKKMQEYNQRKEKVLRGAQRKIEQRKLYDKVRRQDEYPKSFVSDDKQGITRASSLPQIKQTAKTIDLTVAQAIMNPTEETYHGPTKRDGILQLRQSLQNILKLTGQEIAGNFVQSIVKGSLSSAKFFERPEMENNHHDFEKDMQMMKVVQEKFRRNGIPFDMTSLKKAFLTEQTVPSLQKFPQGNLVSNPYYRRWGL